MKLLFSLVALVTVTHAFATPDNAPSQPATNIPELKVLNNWVGKWDDEMTIKPNAALPNGMRAKGQVTAEWALNGRFVQQNSTFDSADGAPAMKVTSMMTYDADKKVYRTWSFFSSGHVSESEGRWDQKSRTMKSTGRNPENGSTFAITATFSADGVETWSIVEKDRDGKIVGETSGKSVPRKK